MRNTFENKVSLPSALKSIEETEEIRIIRLKGSVDFSTVDEIGQFIEKFRAQKEFQYKHLLLDLSEITFVDSSAVARVIKTMLDYKKANHRMVIVNPSSDTRNKSMLEVYKVDKLVHLYHTEAEAIKDLKKES
jgi:anti-anti-sigma factor